MANVKIEGIVLSVREYSDNDAIVNLLVKNSGIESFMIRGYKKSKKQLNANIFVMTNGVFIGTHPKNNTLGYITDIDTVSQVQNISIDIYLSAYLSHIGELFIDAFEKNSVSNFWYLNFLAGINLIEKGAEVKNIVNFFEVRLLEPLGVKPNLYSDSIDGTTTGIFDYSEKYNGIIEKKHFALDEYRLHVSNKVINVLRWYSMADLTKVNNFDISSDTQRAVQRVINLIYDRQIGLKTRSKKVIEQMNAMERLSLNEQG
ncbi:MAG: DNA repair protein RecO [Lactobacillaceae bacterium]|jgi:DNA repair protein RecO|nr:DNA repair protein RecO [Lactobacillaceae bacterium]